MLEDLRERDWEGLEDRQEVNSVRSVATVPEKWVRQRVGQRRAGHLEQQQVGHHQQPEPRHLEQQRDQR